MSYQNIVILTGAGISAESGLLTFRGDDGLWCGHRIEDVATPQGFLRNPDLVHDFYNARRAQLCDVEPNAAHHSLARLQKEHKGQVTLVTQNVDDLHERAGSSPIHMHGELKKIRCDACDKIHDWLDRLDVSTACPACTIAGNLRPHIVWFGEMPLMMDYIYERLRECDLFISIGTSGNVYPAAGFVHEVYHRASAHTVELNLEPSLGNSLFREKIYGNATQVVPSFIDEILS